jgi:hypothetical protein
MGPTPGYLSYVLEIRRGNYRPRLGSGGFRCRIQVSGPWRRSAIRSTFGSIMVIPREGIMAGECLTRLYVQIKDEVSSDTTDTTPA